MSVPVHVFHQTVASLFSPVARLLRTEEVTEIMINGHDEIYVERRGKLQRTPCAFPSEHALMSALRNLAQFVGRRLDAQTPILEARLPDGSRVEAVIPPASPGGPVVSIRRFQRTQLTMECLLQLRAVCQNAAELLRSVVREKKNIVVSGGSGSGKTSLLNALAALAQHDERVIVIEDSKELQLRLPHVVQLEAQPPDPRGRGAVTIRDLLRATLRMRPDRIVIGEIRGGEALDLVQAMTSGHRGCLSTVHGTRAADALARLETMALMSDVDIPPTVIRAQIASGVDIAVQIARRADGARRVTQVTEVLGYDPEVGYRLNDLIAAPRGEG